MKSKHGGFIRFAIYLVILIVLIRFSPFIFRLIQTAVFGLRAFWWVIIPISVIFFLTWKLLKNRSIATKSTNELDRLNLRDVTNSVSEPSEKN